MKRSNIKHIIIEAKMPPELSITQLSKLNPTTTYYITNGHWISDDERIIYITCESCPSHHYDFLKNHKTTKSIDIIGNIIKIHIKSEFLKNLEQKDMTIIYPTTLKNQKHRIEFLLNKDQLDILKKGLKDIKIIKISDTYKENTTLTDRQKEILEKAYSFGYFDYPRKITLTNLAKILKISKATLSQSLRIIEKKAIKSILNKK